jgi:hypothetical protein
MPFTIIPDTVTSYRIVMGRGREAIADIAPEPKPQGRQRKMEISKDWQDETEPKTIHEEDAGTQGAVGSNGENAPAQDKTPEGEGNKEKE